MPKTATPMTWRRKRLTRLGWQHARHTLETATRHFRPHSRKAASRHRLLCLGGARCLQYRCHLRHWRMKRRAASAMHGKHQSLLLPMAWVPRSILDQAQLAMQRIAPPRSTGGAPGGRHIQRLCTRPCRWWRRRRSCLQAVGHLLPLRHNGCLHLRATYSPKRWRSHRRL